VHPTLCLDVAQKPLKQDAEILIFTFDGDIIASERFV
jgi:hypothetical protein